MLIFILYKTNCISPNVQLTCSLHTFLRKVCKMRAVATILALLPLAFALVVQDRVWPYTFLVLVCKETERVLGCIF
jgi:hypothetical protein